MCGIVGYSGQKEALPVLINGLKRLEYRGYDSAGVALFNGGTLNIFKTKGKIADLERITAGGNSRGVSKTGIGHTRWATHGKSNEVNAHPHIDCSGHIAVVHNGIIENYKELKTYLVGKGHKFISETDTEVVPHLIEDFLKVEKGNFLKAFIKAVKSIQGSYAIAGVDADKPEKIYAAHLSSPLVIGKGDGENFLASDSSPFFGKTDKIIYLKEGEVAIISGGSIQTFDLNEQEKDPVVEKLEGTLADIQKSGFAHFMLKEIHEQPERIKDALRGRLFAKEGGIVLGGLEKVWDKIIRARRFIIIGCGTSWHAGLVGEYMLENLAKMPVEVEYASEFRYRNPVIYPDDIVFFISQSGETADTLAALRLVKERGATPIGIVNVVGSSIAREAGAGVYIHAGPEIGVASTKAFTSQLTVLSLITLAIAKEKWQKTETFKTVAGELESIPEKVERVLKNEAEIKKIAKIFKNSRNFLYLGRGANFPTALEGALKLKEISYIHAEGYPAAEMKHGPIALIDSEMPVVFIAPQDAIYEKVLSNIEEVRARGGRIIAIANENDKEIEKLAEFVIRVPRTLSYFGPMVNVIPLQLLAYYIALAKGCNIDQPRNLAKSVTVE